MSTTKDPQQKKAPVIQINQEVLHNNLSDYVRKNLEDVLNELLDAEADRLCHVSFLKFVNGDSQVYEHLFSNL